MRRFTALVNPIAGRGNGFQRWEPVRAALAAAGHDVETARTAGAADARARAESAAADGRIVVAVGGDGLVRDVCAGVVAGGGEMAVVPAGRGNDLAAALDLLLSAADIADLLRHGRSRPTDVIEVGGTVVPGNVYCGIDVVAGALIERSRWMTPWLAYRLAPLAVVATWHAPTYTVNIDGTARTLRGHTVVIGNTGRYGHGLHIVPTARADDGLLDVLLVGDLPRWAILPFLLRARTGAHLHRPRVSVVRAREVTVIADRPVAAGADGEALAALPITARVRPGALPLFRP